MPHRETLSNATAFGVHVPAAIQLQIMPAIECNLYPRQTICLGSKSVSKRADSNKSLAEVQLQCEGVLSRERGAGQFSN